MSERAKIEQAVRELIDPISGIWRWVNGEGCIVKVGDEYDAESPITARDYGETIIFRTDVNNLAEFYGITREEQDEYAVEDMVNTIIHQR